MPPWPSAAKVRFRCADVPLLDSGMRGGSELDPTPLRRIRSQDDHSAEVTASPGDLVLAPFPHLNEQELCLL